MPASDLNSFDAALEWILRIEGGYVDHPGDPGGPTNYGITHYTARRYGYRGSMRNIPLALVRDIYRNSYWDRCYCGTMPDHPLRFVMFDAAVHSGPGQAIKWLQKELAITADGIMGLGTITAIEAHPNLDALSYELIDRRERFLRSLKTWKTFARGWSNRLSDLREIVRDA